MKVNHAETVRIVKVEKEKVEAEIHRLNVTFINERLAGKKVVGDVRVERKNLALLVGN